ncbi:hypothetical protein BDR06DRAFT_971947 [Suillus hirtellus]|nr:hypothetical protein BDR06DRAFT_971947 [Suillus hirtellus]
MLRMLKMMATFSCHHQVKSLKLMLCRPTNPIYLFYEEVVKNAQGVEGIKGDKHYKCYHGLISHIKTHFLVLYRLYLYLKDHVEPPTEDEVAMASEKKIPDPTQAAEYLLQLEKASSNIVKALTTQNHLMFSIQKANWDQNMFKQLLTEWMVTSMKLQVMKMGKDTVADVKEMIAELNCNVIRKLAGQRF